MFNGPPTGPSPLEQRDRLVGTNGVRTESSENIFQSNRKTNSSTVIVVDCDSGGGDSSAEEIDINGLLERLPVFRRPGRSCSRSSSGNRCQLSHSFQPRRSSALGQIHELWFRETRSKTIQSNV